MFKIATLKKTLSFCFGLCMASPAFAGSDQMFLKSPAAPPIGYVQFCKVHPADCQPLKKTNQIIRLTEASWAQINDVNTSVNVRILPATDMQVYGVLERWEYPKVAGDCEDYVLEKRLELIQAGWPESALLITVVRDEAGKAIEPALAEGGEFTQAMRQEAAAKGIDPERIQYEHIMRRRLL